MVSIVTFPFLSPVLSFFSFSETEDGIFSLQHKSGKELQGFLCNDFLLLTRENSSLAKKIGKDSEKQYVMYQPVGIVIRIIVSIIIIFIIRIIVSIIIIITNNKYCLFQPIRLNEITVKVPDQNSMLNLISVLICRCCLRM